MLVATVIDFPVHDIQYIVTVIVKPSNITSKPPVYTESELSAMWVHSPVFGARRESWLAWLDG
jgi:hypothetical protein